MGCNLGVTATGKGNPVIIFVKVQEGQKLT